MRRTMGHSLIQWQSEIGSQYRAYHVELESLVFLALSNRWSVAYHLYRLKCDRQVPCASCSKRGDEGSCVYSNGSGNRRDRRGGESRDSEAQLRLQRLEEMITSLMRTTKEDSEGRSDKSSPRFWTAEQRFTNLSPPASDSSLEAQLNPSVSEKNYVSATHWTTILENVGVSCGEKALIRS